MRKVLLVISSVVLICAARYVMAQTAPKAHPAPPASASEPDRDTQLRLATLDTSTAAFRKLDKDNDGRISPLEAADNAKLAAAFTLADKDKDGYLSREEFEALGSNPHSSDVDASSPSGDQPAQPPR